MNRVTVLVVSFLFSRTVVYAVPVDCTSLATFQQYITQSDSGGCFVQDTIFTNFRHTGAMWATNTVVGSILSSTPGKDIHGFAFTTATGIPVWSSGFTVADTISVDPAVNPGARINSATLQGNFGSFPMNAAGLALASSNGVNQNVPVGAESGVNTSPDTLAAATIPDGGFLISVEETFTQSFAPEPGSQLLLGVGLLGIAALICRRARKRA